MNFRLFSSFFRVVLIVGIFFMSFSAAAWAHGDATSIVPEKLNAQSGSELKVTVSGLTGTKTAVFRLSGMTGEWDLGTFPIDTDDFTKTLNIPEDVPPGSYRLEVEGGKKKAKAIIQVN